MPLWGGHHVTEFTHGTSFIWILVAWYFPAFATCMIALNYLKSGPVRADTAVSPNLFR